MRKLVAAAAACSFLAFAGCTAQQSFDETVAANLPKACNIAAQMHAAFLVVAATGKISESIVNKEAQAVAALQVACADPAAVSSSNALIVAANAFAAWASAGVQQ